MTDIKTHARPSTCSVLWTVEGWKTVLRQRRQNNELVHTDSLSWTEAQWQASYELGRERFDEFVAAQPDHLVFNESELIFASFAVCDFFGIDPDDDVTCGEIQDLLKSRGRVILPTATASRSRIWRLVPLLTARLSYWSNPFKKLSDARTPRSDARSV